MKQRIIAAFSIFAALLLTAPPLRAQDLPVIVRDADGFSTRDLAGKVGVDAAGTTLTSTLGVIAPSLYATTALRYTDAATSGAVLQAIGTDGRAVWSGLALSAIIAAGSGVGPDLSAIEALTGTGLLARTAADTWALRTLAAGNTGVEVTAGDGATGNPTVSHKIAEPMEPIDNSGATFVQDLTFDLYGHLTGATSVNAAAALSGVFQPLDADLTALAALAGTGIAVRTASNTWAQRTITGDAEIVVTNGDGVAGNPALAIAAAIARDTELPVGANPGAAITGGVAVNGSATTFMRSNGAPALGPTLTWGTGLATQVTMRNTQTTTLNKFFWQNAGGTSNAWTMYEDASGNGILGVRNTANAERVRLHSAGNSYFTGGNLGVGISVPVELMQIASATPSAARLRVTETGDSTSAHFSGLALYDGTTFRGGIFKQGDNHALAFWDASAQRMTLLQGGNVGIGDPTPDLALEVVGSFGLTGGGADGGRIFANSSNTIFNEDGADIDFRVEGDGDANALVVNAGLDSVGIGTATPGDGKLHVNAGALTPYYGTTTALVGQNLVSTESSADPTILTYRRLGGSQSNNDELWRMQFYGQSSTNVERIYSQIATTAVLATNAAEEGRLVFSTMIGGNLTPVISLSSAGITFLAGTSTATLNNDGSGGLVLQIIGGQNFRILNLPVSDPNIANAVFTDGIPGASDPKFLMMSGG